jgi:hypothetical protein
MSRMVQVFRSSFVRFVMIPWLDSPGSISLLPACVVAKQYYCPAPPHFYQTYVRNHQAKARIR